MRRCNRIHLLERSIQVAIIEFMVATDVNDRAAERLACPLHAPGFHADVARQDDNVTVLGRRREVFEFGM